MVPHGLQRVAGMGLVGGSVCRFLLRSAFPAVILAEGTRVSRVFPPGPRCKLELHRLGGHSEYLHPVVPGGCCAASSLQAPLFQNLLSASPLRHRPSEIARTVLLIVLFFSILGFAKHLNAYIPAALFKQNMKTS